MKGMLLPLSLCVVTLIQLTSSETRFTCVQQDAGEVVDRAQRFGELMTVNVQLQGAVAQLQSAVSRLQRDSSQLVRALSTSQPEHEEGRHVFVDQLFIIFYYLSRCINVICS